MLSSTFKLVLKFFVTIRINDSEAAKYMVESVGSGIRVCTYYPISTGHQL